MKAVRASIVVLCLAPAVFGPGTAAAQTVSFLDTNLEYSVRSALSMPTGFITRSNFAGLISLNACCASITNLFGLEWATNLVDLDLSGNLLRELGPLAGLTQLTNLNVGGNQITNLGALSGLTNLDALWLYGNPLQNYSSITNLTRLTSLTLYNSCIADATPLACLTNLKYLELRWNPLSNAQVVLPALTNLTTLYLGGSAISNVSFLQSLTRLRSLNLDHNQVKDFSPLAVLTVLTNLDIGYNPVTNAAPAGPFPNLTGLYLSGISLSNVTVLANLGGLRSLTLCNNNISDLSPLTGLTNLLELGLSGNPAVSHGPLAALTNLTTLWLEGNAVSNLTFVEGLKSLRALGLRQNRVGNLGGIGGLSNLLAVLADQNRLTDIAGLQNLPRLSKVQLTGNLLDLSNGSPAKITIENLITNGAQVSYLPQNQPPTISLQSAWNVPLSLTSTLNFQVSDDVTPVQQLTVTASSMNPLLIPDSGVVIGGPGAKRTLTVTPLFALTGTVGVTVTVTDGAGVSTNATVFVNVLVPQPVTIADPDLEREIRLELGKPTGVLTSLDLEQLTELNIFDTGISTLAGLEAATNLTSLLLHDTFTTNLTAAQYLQRLTYLELVDNGVTDLSPVIGLTALQGLVLNGNVISNLNFLQNLTGLTYLNLEDNRLADLSQLSAMTNLNYLSLNENLITNPLPIQNLPALLYVDLRQNLLNTTTNSAAMSVIKSLTNRNVQVDYLPQRGPPTFVSPASWMVTTGATSVLFINITTHAVSDSLLMGTRSSNTNVLPYEKFQVSQYTNHWWTLTVSPVGTVTGATTIRLTATNDLGFSNRYDIVVTVAAPLPFDGGVVNSTFTWRTGANAPWEGQSAVTHDGTLAARSDALFNGQQSWLETTLQGPGVLSFWWKVSSETNQDWLEFYLDGGLSPPRISGNVDWQQRSINIPMGAHKARWQYAKNYECCSAGSDAAWLDQVTFVPQSWLELTSAPTNGKCWLLLHPVPGRLYEVQGSTNQATWFRLAFLAPASNAVPFLDSAAISPSRFYRLHEFLADAIWLQTPGLAGNQVQLVLHSPPDLRFEMQVSTNLLNWTALSVITNVTGTIPFTDLRPTNSFARYYRARLLP